MSTSAPCARSADAAATPVGPDPMTILRGTALPASRRSQRGHALHRVPVTAIVHLEKRIRHDIERPDRDADTLRVGFAGTRPESRHDHAVASRRRAADAAADIPRDRRGPLRHDRTLPVSAPASQYLHVPGEGDEFLRVRGRSARLSRAGRRVRQQLGRDAQRLPPAVCRRARARGDRRSLAAVPLQPARGRAHPCAAAGRAADRDPAQSDRAGVLALSLCAKGSDRAAGRLHGRARRPGGPAQGALAAALPVRRLRPLPRAASPLSRAFSPRSDQALPVRRLRRPIPCG